MSCRQNRHGTQRLQQGHTREKTILTLNSPISPETRLASEVAHAFSNVRLLHSWYAFVPAYIGSDPSIDAAARAILPAHSLSLQTHKDKATETTSTRRYFEAVKVLRSHLTTSDSTLISVALLLFVSGLLNAKCVEIHAHMQGLNAILEAQPASRELSDLRRCLLWAVVDEHFRSSCGLGTASPFDQDRWLDVKWDRDGEAGSPGLSRLQQLKYSLSIRLPRLVAKVRSWRTIPAIEYIPEEQLKEAIELSEELLALSDAAAESRLLHKVRVVATTDSTKRAIMTSSYDFPASEECETALHYWYLRLVAIKLRLVLADLTTFTTSPFDSTALRAEQERLIANIIMTWLCDSATRLNPKCLQLTLIIVWGALSDMKTFRKMTASVVRSWVLRSCREVSQGETLEVTPAFLDEASELVAGGSREMLATMDVRAIGPLNFERRPSSVKGVAGRACC